MLRVRMRNMALIAALLLVASACGESGSEKASTASEESRTAESDSSEESSADGESTSEETTGDSNVPLEATGPVAEIDGETIGADAFNEVVQKQFGNSPRPVPKSLAKRLKGKLITRMVEKHLLEREIEEAGVEVSDEETEKEMERFKEQFPNEKAYEKFLSSRQMDKEQLEDKVKKDVKLKKMLEEKRDVQVTEKEAKEHYENNIDRYKQPEQVKARHILIKAEKEADKKEAKKRAEELAKKARKKGTDFAKLAEKNSEGPSAKKGGDLGYFARDRMVGAFAEKAFGMKKGEISDPVETRFGYHVIKREGHREAKTESFESVKEEIVSKLEREKFQKAVDSYVEELRNNAEITEKPENVEVRASGREPGRLPGKGGKKMKIKGN